MGSEPSTREDMLDAIAHAKEIKPDEKTVRMLAGLQSAHVCKRCGKCCMDMTIGMTGKEAINISRKLKIPGSEFRRLYISQQVQGWLIIRNHNGMCPFLLNEGGTFSCAIHEVRPTVCRNYPFMTPSMIEESKFPGISIIPDICPFMRETVEKANDRILKNRGD